MQVASARLGISRGSVYRDPDSTSSPIHRQANLRRSHRQRGPAVGIAGGQGAGCFLALADHYPFVIVETSYGASADSMMSTLDNLRETMKAQKAEQAKQTTQASQAEQSFASRNESEAPQESKEAKKAKVTKPRDSGEPLGECRFVSCHLPARGFRSERSWRLSNNLSICSTDCWVEGGTRL